MREDTLLEALTTEPPSISTDEAEQVVNLQFGIEVRAVPLPSERDQNFKLTTAGGTQFVLHLANRFDNPGVVDLQARALLHIEDKAPNLPVPRIVRTRTGALFAQSDTRSGQLQTAWLLSYREGSPLQLVSVTSEVRQSIGATLARLDLALRDFTHRYARRQHPWDLLQASRLFGLLTYVQGTKRRRLAEQVLQRFECRAAEAATNLRLQVIHNDFNLSNVLVNPDHPYCVVGILDFGDMVEAPLINDVAVAAAYHVAGDGDPLQGAAELVSAYHAVNPLQDEELRFLFDLIGARLATTVIITEWRAQRFPNNAEFILKNNPKSWIALEAMQSVLQRDGEKRFIEACLPRAHALANYSRLQQ